MKSIPKYILYYFFTILDGLFQRNLKFGNQKGSFDQMNESSCVFFQLNKFLGVLFVFSRQYLGS